MGNAAPLLVLLTGLALLAVAVAIAVHLASGRWIERVGRPHLLRSLGAIPPSALIVVLGCPPRTLEGRPNPLFLARVATAAAAYHHAPGRRILCSGRLDPEGLHEADELATALAEAAVPLEAIDLDRDAQRTIDSIAYLKAHHAHEPILLVTQSFHLTRSLFLARRAELGAHGLPAEGPRPARRVRLRETFARTRAAVDSLLSHRRPDRRTDDRSDRRSDR